MIISELLENLEMLREGGNDFGVLSPDFNPALLGYCYDYSAGCFRVIYDRLVILHTLCVDNNFSMEDAVEWFDYNIVGSCPPAAAPMFLESRVG